MKLFRTCRGVLAEYRDRFFVLPIKWDDIFRKSDPRASIAELLTSPQLSSGSWLRPDEADVLAPIGSQEVWAAGVTYFRSRDARMEESRMSSGGDCYARVYDAPRPELFFKSTPHRVVGHGQRVRLRHDSRWNVPEPELTLAVNSAGKVFGYTVGNDMSSRDIEGENPLYLPQAKVYDGSCALGPGLLITDDPPGPETAIHLSIARAGDIVFAGQTTLAQLKRRPTELVEYLFRDNSFPDGVLLMTGTGVVPPSDFSLSAGDTIRIEIAGVGELVNIVAAP